jgi:hypothetical protein
MEAGGAALTTVVEVAENCERCTAKDEITLSGSSSIGSSEPVCTMERPGAVKQGEQGCVSRSAPDLSAHLVVEYNDLSSTSSSITKLLGRIPADFQLEEPLEGQQSCGHEASGGQAGRLLIPADHSGGKHLDHKIDQPSSRSLTPAASKLLPPPSPPHSTLLPPPSPCMSNMSLSEAGEAHKETARPQSRLKRRVRRHSEPSAAACDMDTASAGNIPDATTAPHYSGGAVLNTTVLDLTLINRSKKSDENVVQQNEVERVTSQSAASAVGELAGPAHLSSTPVHLSSTAHVSVKYAASAAQTDAAEDCVMCTSSHAMAAGLKRDLTTVQAQLAKVSCEQIFNYNVAAFKFSISEGRRLR